MPSDDALFVNDDLNNSAENRLNHVLFGLFLKGEYRWEVLDRLGVSKEAIIYKPGNQSWGGRPDFAIESYGGETIGFIESELDKDPVQLAVYRAKAPVPVFSFGRVKEDHDITLQELVEIGQGIVAKDPDPQLHLMVRHLTKQVSEASGVRKSRPPGPVRSQMETKLGQALVAAGMVNRGEGLPGPGKFFGQSSGQNGISVRVFSPNSKIRKSASLFYITGGQPIVRFLGYVRLKKYLPPEKSVALEGWIDFLEERFGSKLGEVRGLGEKEHLRVELSRVEDNIDDLIRKMLPLV